MPRNDWSSPFGYPEALQAIWARSAYDRGHISNPFAGDAAAALGLRRTEALLEKLGSPHNTYGIVHVAGSKGKGSTCAFAAAILGAAGYRVGRYTSPHLHAFRERIAVDGEPITEPAFAELTERAVAAAVAVEREEPDLGDVTAFELVTAMALAHFATAGCAVAVVETGMGGTLDATNVVTPLVSAITALDLEHTAVLGSTLPEIAANKAGIIKPGVPVVVSPQPREAMAVIEQTAARCGSPLLAAGRDWTWSGEWRAFTAVGPWGSYPNLRSGLPGAHQVENACTAVAAVLLLRDRGFAVSEAAVRDGLADAHWPGRFERIATDDGHDIVLDGAHTPASAAALAAATGAEYPNRRAVVVIGTFGDKDPAAILRPLSPLTDHVIAAQARGPRATPSTAVADAARDIGLPAESRSDVATALTRARELAQAGDLVVVTGSLAVVAEAREALGLARPDPPLPHTN